MIGRLVAVYRDDLETVTLVYSFIKGDGLEAKMIPDVTSEPLQSPGAHNVKSQYKLHVILVPEEDVERAYELIEAWQERL